MNTNNGSNILSSGLSRIKERTKQGISGLFSGLGGVTKKISSELGKALHKTPIFPVK